MQTFADFELTLVDNASTDDSLKYVENASKEYGLSVRILRNSSNHGFAPACNQGIAATDTPFVVMLNNDTVPDPNWLEQLVITAESNQQVGMVASKMLFAHQPDRINSTGIALDWTGIAGIEQEVQKIRWMKLRWSRFSGRQGGRRCIHAIY